MQNPEAVAWLEAQIEHGEPLPRGFQLAEQMIERTPEEAIRIQNIINELPQGEVTVNLTGYEVIARAYAAITAYVIGEEE